MSYSVYLHPYAEADYNHIYAYIEEHSAQGAENWDLALDQAIKRLKIDPKRYGRIPEQVVSKAEHKQASFRTKRGKPYRLIFMVKGNLVTILRIRGPGQADVTPQDLPDV